MAMKHSAWILVCLALPTVARGQTDSSARPRNPLCWRGKPAPQCGSFWITEISGEYAYATTQTHYRFDYGNSVSEYSRPDVSSQLLWTVGPMFNTSPTRAFGGTLSAGFVNDGSRIAIEARRRYWTSPGSGVDVSAGVLRTNVPPLPNQFEHAQYGTTAGVYVVGGDLIHINAHADVLLTGDRVRAGATVGGGFGGYAAVGVTVLAGALALAVIIEFLRGCGDC
jgi:hypothetical protein